MTDLTFNLTLHVPPNSIGPVTLWCRKQLVRWTTEDDHHGSGNWRICFVAKESEINEPFNAMCKRWGVVTQMVLLEE